MLEALRDSNKKTVRAITHPTPSRSSRVRACTHQCLTTGRRFVLLEALIVLLLSIQPARARTLPSYRISDSTSSVAVIVKVRPGYIENETVMTSALARQVHQWATAAGAGRANALWPASGAAMSTAIDDDHPGRRTFVVAPDSGVSADDLARRLGDLPWVEYAEVDRLFSLYAAPNDPLYTRQWHLENTGQPYWSVVRIAGDNNDTLASLTGKPGADVGFSASYSHPGPKAAVPVGIVDTGIETDHEDIADRLFVNTGEIPGNGIDDDHNGFIDDVYGWDFSGDVAMSPLDVAGDNDVSDQIGHGTHVAGTVAATVNNGIGIAGVADSARVFAIKVFPNAYFSVTSRAIYYAVMRGARVVNMSWGGAYRSRALEDALQYAYNHGVVLVASMGNSGDGSVLYPSACSMTIGVGASTAGDELARFSTHNDSIDVVAPGQDVLSLRALGTDLYASGGEPGIHIINDGYYIASGTSMAAPHVTGAAAALLSIAPGLSNARVRQILTSTADDIVDPYGDGTNLPGFDRYTGWGRINLERAIAALPRVFVSIGSPDHGEWAGGSVVIRGYASGASFIGYSVKVAPGHHPGSSGWTTLSASTTPVDGGTLATWNSTGLGGPYTIRLDAGTDAIFDVPVNLVQTAVASIGSPISGQSVRLLATVVGTAVAPDFQRYRLEAIGPLPSTTLHPIREFTRPVWNDTLGLWELDQLPSGSYWLRLTLETGSGTHRDSSQVTVESAFHTGWPVTLPAFTHFAVATVDLDGNGTDEIVCPTSRGLWVLSADGTPYPGWPRDTLVDFRTPPAFADLDNDGKYEIIIATPDSMRVYAFIGEQYAGWPRPFAARERFFGVSLPTIGNLDGEGPLEIVAIDSSGKINAWHEDGTTYTPLLTPSFGAVKCSNTLGYGLPRASICDLEGEGLPELVVAGDSVYIFDGRTGLPYHRPADPSAAIKGYHSTHGMAIGDFDRDGNREIAVLATQAALGNFLLEIIKPDGSTLPGWPRSIPQTMDKYVLYSLAVGDVDGDRIPELFFAPYSVGDGLLYAYHANGSPLVSDSTTGLFAPLPGSSSAVVLVDIDDDKRPEIVLRIGELLFGPDQIYALEADGSFVPGYPITFGFGSSTLMSAPVVGDVDNDGQADMVTVQSTGKSVALWDLTARFSPRGRPWPRFQADIWNSGVIPSPNYDVIYLVRMIDMLFRAGNMFPPYEPTDMNCDGRTNLIDVVFLINYIFSGGTAPCVL